MTSEVVVMNRMAVALAADSAVTIEVGDTSKVRDSALKLFTLSKYGPVGVMVYDNPSILGVPLETIIKMFRRELGRGRFDTLREYGEALIQFLDGNMALFPGYIQERYFLQTLETEYRSIEKRAREELLDSGLYGEDREESSVDNADWAEREIEHRVEFWRSQEDADYFSHVSAQDVLNRNSRGISDVVHEVFGGWQVGQGGVRNLREIAEYLVSKDHIPDDVFSGLVIAGFGEQEHFPAVQHIEIGGVYGDRLKAPPCSLQKVSDEKPSYVMAFGYSEMVDGFLDGISGDAYEHLTDAATFLTEMPVSALDAITGLAADDRERFAKVVRRASERKASEFAKNVFAGTTARREEIGRVVESLSINELAQVASTLVGLSSFEQRMSLNRETVGGPVDVAVISKGDGFIWMDRKHYFRKELNSHFFRNYYDDGVTKSDKNRRRDSEGVQDGE